MNSPWNGRKLPGSVPNWKTSFAITAYRSAANRMRTTQAERRAGGGWRGWVSRPPIGSDGGNSKYPLRLVGLLWAAARHERIVLSSSNALTSTGVELGESGRD